MTDSQQGGSAGTTEQSTSRSASDSLLTVRNLKKHYPVRSGLFNRIQQHVKAVDGVSFDIERGETFAVVGESGCGKTTLGKTLARLYSPTEGEIRFDGQDIASLSERQLKSVRRNIQVVYQDPSSSLNPRRRIEDIIAEPLVVHEVGTKDERKKRVAELLRRVDLPVEFKHRYPSALSGGQKQRVAVARAVALEPKFVVLDEPTSALDVSVQAKIISLLDELQTELELTYLIISHDLSLVKNIADRIGVMYLGQLMEVADSEKLFKNPLNPYTEKLLSAIPTVYETEEALKPPTVDIEGETPNPANPPSGCPFHPRCHKQFEPCDEIHPDLIEADDEHAVRCLLYPSEKDVEVRNQLPSDTELADIRTD
ncbi:ABC transporter ATP-binding protein [Halocatena marina]|uniref:ABC transporter ATP-binding protein n=1 Tax=Halocatena marina TaxID=2934937 RepID=UPI00222498D7|nr:oligopeptide/dipeptide ABC transporter ATP-binding protein [Halocatena marina]